MKKDLLVIEVECHTDAPEDFSIIRRIEIPDIDHLLYALPDKPNERYTAEEFKSLMKKIKFKRTSELALIVIDKRSGKRRGLVCPLSWPEYGKPGMMHNRVAFDLP
jgi:hypothetical protein